jgi:hypothetical protein
MFVHFVLREASMPQEVDTIEPDAVADIPAPDLNTKPPRRRAPAGACDCHLHIFGEPNKVELNPGREYTPAEADLAQHHNRDIRLSSMHEKGGPQQDSLFTTKLNIA